MNDKQSARELLRDARVALYDEMHGVHNGSFMDGLERRNRKDTLIATIDAYLAAPSESAMEMVEKIRDLESYGGGDYEYYLDATDAAALIEGYGRRVPRAMLEEIWVEASRFDANGEYKSIDEIAAKHGVEVD